ncbi:MAG: hypothetical protein H0X25_05280 [Acidobacteriales bacterium]|nr:hypothetical protein [Terriglobales bacterium]
MAKPRNVVRQQVPQPRRTPVRGFLIAIALVAILGGAYYAYSHRRKPGPADALAKCLTQKGVKMYGAYWCPHCAEQKESFGTSFEYVTYVECAVKGSKVQAQVCKDANILHYPTWEFGDKSRLEGPQDFKTLKDKAGCSLQ